MLEVKKRKTSQYSRVGFCLFVFAFSLPRKLSSAMFASRTLEALLQQRKL